jgi:hypothetical protein
VRTPSKWCPIPLSWKSKPYHLAPRHLFTNIVSLSLGADEIQSIVNGKEDSVSSYPPSTTVIAVMIIPTIAERIAVVSFALHPFPSDLKYPTMNNRIIPRKLERYKAELKSSIMKNGSTTIKPAPADKMKVLVTMEMVARVVGVGFLTNDTKRPFEGLRDSQTFSFSFSFASAILENPPSQDYLVDRI